MANSSIYSPYLNKSSRSTSGSSRLIKKEQKKMSQQTILMIIASIAILILFIFVIVPSAIRIFFSLIDKTSPFEEKDTIPPRVPLLQSPVEATNSATIPVAGVGEAASKVIFVLNGNQQAEVDVNDEGKFEYELMLEDGDNSLSVYGIDQAGNESVQTKTYQIIFDNQAPLLEVEYPADGTQVELRKNQVIEIKGKTDPNSKVYINDRFVFPNSDGSFTHRYQLSEGENILKFRVTDLAGNVSEQEIKVTFKL